MTACPTPHKAKYLSERSAIKTAIWQSSVSGKHFRVYRCPCRKYHTTSSSLSDYESKRPKSLPSKKPQVAPSDAPMTVHQRKDSGDSMEPLVTCVERQAMIDSEAWWA